MNIDHRTVSFSDLIGQAIGSFSRTAPFDGRRADRRFISTRPSSRVTVSVARQTHTVSDLNG